MTTAYGICLVISVLAILWIAFRNYEKPDSYYWTIIIIIPIIIAGYWLKTQVLTQEAAMMLFCFIYLDSTILLTLVVFLMCRAMKIRVAGWIKLTAYSAAFVHLFIVWTSIHNGMYFKTITLTHTDLGTVTGVTHGPLFYLHYVYLGILMLTILSIFIVAIFRKGSYSRLTLGLYGIVSSAGVLLYVVEAITNIPFSLLPFLYTLGELLIVLGYERIYAHDISSVVSEQQKNYGTRGHAAFDLQRRFLSCNPKIYNYWPDLRNQRIDDLLPEGSHLRGVFYSMIDAYEKRGIKSEKYKIGEMTCVCEITPFSFSKSKRIQGYFFEVRDATKEQEALDIMSSYNESLNAEVRAKTENIIEIQGKIVAGMANMIENRDNNTGGHVKRTSDIIRIILDEIIKQGAMEIDEDFATDIVRAAPMHDLGKLTVENSILNKPGKLTEEEYTIMKRHSTKSGEMVMILLDGIEEDHFVKVAYHVARYHHERWDGKGYPEQLVGSMIPVEARIMAVADVYDALSSKRCYKNAMSPDQAAKIMIEGMGTQFDPRMKPVFQGCRERLEAYYKNVEK